MQPTRSEVNRANAEHSTGPRTEAGKARSAQNSFRHGLFSKQLILPCENPYEFDALRCSLRAEHQPSNTVEEILVDELAQAFWRLRRVRAFEASAWQSEEEDMLTRPDWTALIQRAMSAAERCFHKALATLSKLRKDAGVPLTPAATQADELETGFVPQTSCEATTCPSTQELEFIALSGRHAAPCGDAGFVPQNDSLLTVDDLLFADNDELDFDEDLDLEHFAA